MDKLRAFGKILFEQRFWVLSVLGLSVACVCWWMSAGELQAKFSQRKSAIDSVFSGITRLKGEPACPNEVVNTANQEKVAEQAEYVQEVWKTLYERQREGVLSWPKELGDEFIEYIEMLKFRDPIKNEMRTIYQNYIENRFDGLLEIVKAKKDTTGNVGGYGGGGLGGEEFGGRREFGGGAPVNPGQPLEPGEDEAYLVHWVDQNVLRARLDFSAAKPSATQIWVTQEDLWVYETLLNVIANTNKARKATRPDNTAIRMILALEVGTGAARATGMSGYVLMPQAAAGGGAMSGELGGRSEYLGDVGGGFGGGESSGMREGGRSFGGALEGESNDSLLLANRYLDDAGAPLAGNAASFGVEFRQLPIHMSLLMDQRWLPRLLIECANAALPIEVKQVRLNPDRASVGFEQSRGGYSNPAANLQGVEADPSHAQIELQGAVYIYNEPTAEPAGTATADDQLAAGVQ